tara:strand:- start:3935 stop:4417 length:483 start_codon:yes stop_codon:yes gene_type:complete
VIGLAKMGKYKILISFATGDSFNNYDTTDNIELEWDNLEVAKENLQAIREHDKMCDLANNWKTKFEDKIKHYQDNEDKFWFVSEVKPLHNKKKCYHTMVAYEKAPEDFTLVPDDYSAQHLIKFKADNGNLMQTQAFWVGYFESFQSAEIITDESDMKYVK